MAHSGAWRVGDVLAYDAMRDAAAELVGVLLSEPDPGDDVLSAAVAVRRVSLDVDGHDRQAVDAATLQFRGRLDELADHHG